MGVRVGRILGREEPDACSGRGLGATTASKPSTHCWVLRQHLGLLWVGVVASLGGGVWCLVIG
jgi:hypothetical protein